MSKDNPSQSTALRRPGTLRSVLSGLQFKGTAILTAFLLLLAILADTLIQKNISRLASSQQIAYANDVCSMLSVAAADDLKQKRIEELQLLTRRFAPQQPVVYVEFYDHRGRQLSRYHGGLLKPRPLTPKLAQHTSRPTFFEKSNDHPPYLDVVQASWFSSPDHADAELAGYVRMGIDLTDTQSGLVRFLQGLRNAGIVFILLMVPVAFLVVRHVTHPINELGRVVKQFAEGELRVRSRVSRSDEIGQLAKSFNVMADELSKSNDRLVKLNAELEDRVLQRTRQLKDLAARDPLTGLYNRRHLNEVMIRRFAEAERYNSDLSCLMIDLDNFKKVNDQFGHEKGDALLVLTAKVIKSELRGADVGARFGGDEFCVLLPQTSAEQAHQVGQRIVHRFEQEVSEQLPDNRLEFGISVGVAGMQELRLVHPDELMKSSDQALYEAKTAGKNRIHLAAALP